MKKQVIMLLLVIGNMCHAQIKKWKEYKSVEKGYSVKYPDGWIADNGNPEVDVFKTNVNAKIDIAGVVTVVIHDLSNITLDRANLLNVTMNIIKGNHGMDVKCFNSKRSTFNGKEKWEIEYTYSITKKETAKVVMWMVEDAGKLYEVTFTGESLETGREVLGTFALMDGAPSKQGNTSPSSSNASQLGSIAPNAKYIEADEMRPFHDGFAIVQKGKLMGVINTNGDFVLPYGNYAVSIVNEPRFINGFMQVVQSSTDRNQIQRGGFLNRNGKLIWLADQQIFERPFSKNGKAIVRNGHYLVNNDKTLYYLVDSFGKRLGNIPDKEFLSLTGNMSLIGQHDELYPFQGYVANKSKWGYVSYEGKTAIPLQFDGAERFSDGLAAVCKLDEFGVKKWGYINTKGETVIPFVYTNKPSSFENGYALVEPKDKSEFMAAYIDKTNRIALKLPTKKADEYYRPIQPAFRNGYAIWKYVTSNGGGLPMYWDILGNQYSDGDLMKKYNAKFNHQDYLDTYEPNKATGEINGTKIYWAKRNNRKYEENVFAYIDLVKGTSGELPAAYLAMPEFDGAASLAFATYFLGRNAAGQPIYRKGYINEQGMFVIVMKEESKW